MRIAIFTDNDFDKTNGVTTTLRAVLRHSPPDLQPRIYTMSDIASKDRDYLALASIGVPIPWYGEMACMCHVSAHFGGISQLMTFSSFT